MFLDCISDLSTLAGKVLWHADVSFMNESWSCFNVCILPDFNDDGVPELLLSHSSDPRFPPEVGRFNIRLCIFRIKICENDTVNTKNFILVGSTILLS